MIAIPVALIVYYVVAYSSEPRRINRRLDALAATLSIPAQGGSDLDRVTRLAQLRHFFTEDVQVTQAGSAPAITSREALLGAISVWTPPPGGWTIEFMDVQVTLDADRIGASVYLTAKISGHDARTGEPTVDAREATLRMRKEDNEWVIARVEARDTLEKP